MPEEPAPGVRAGHAGCRVVPRLPSRAFCAVPRAAVVSARIVPDGMDEVHGLRLPGTGFPGVIMVGTWRDEERVTFAVCHGRRPAVVVELTGQRYDRIVVTVENPGEVVARLA